MTKPRMIVAALVALGGLATGAALLAQGPVRYQFGTLMEVPVGKALIEAKLAAAREVYEVGMNLWQNAREEFDEIPTWSRRWMDEEIRLAADPAAKIAAITAHLERVKSMEKFAYDPHDLGRRNNYSLLRANYFRLEAEEMLADAKANPAAMPRPVSK